MVVIVVVRIRADNRARNIPDFSTELGTDVRLGRRFDYAVILDRAQMFW